MDRDKEKDIDQQSNPSFTKKDLTGKQEQSEPAEQAEKDGQQSDEAERDSKEESEGEGARNIH